MKPDSKKTAPPLLVIENLLSDTSFASLRHFVVNSARHGGQYEERFHRTIAHTPVALRDAHRELAHFASEITGQKLKPSYNVVANYLPGGVCPLHADRDQCFYTIDLLVAQESKDTWPLLIGEYWTDDQWDAHGYKDPERHDKNIQPEDLDVEWTKVELKPNHAVCYSGTNSWHYRPGESQGRTDMVLFHFVTEDFDGPLN